MSDSPDTELLADVTEVTAVLWTLVDAVADARHLSSEPQQRSELRDAQDHLALAWAEAQRARDCLKAADL